MKVTFGSGRHVWWMCDKGHEWQAKVHHRSQGVGCPYCAGQRATKDNCLEVMNPALAQEWHPVKNAPLTPHDIMVGSNKKIWWKCTKGHEWKTTVSHRSSGQGCPYCAGRKVCEDNCLQTVRPKIANEWHPTRNAPLTPRDVTCGSEKKVWWRCARGHEWNTSVLHRRAQGCPYCSGRRCSEENSLAVLNAYLAGLWDVSKNGWRSPKDVGPYSERKIWWKCSKGHEWREPVIDLSRRGGCPECLLRVSNRK